MAYPGPVADLSSGWKEKSDTLDRHWIESRKSRLIDLLPPGWYPIYNNQVWQREAQNTEGEATSVQDAELADGPQRASQIDSLLLIQLSDTARPWDAGIRAKVEDYCKALHKKLKGVYPIEVRSKTFEDRAKGLGIRFTNEPYNLKETQAQLELLLPRVEAAAQEIFAGRSLSSSIVMVQSMLRRPAFRIVVEKGTVCNWSRAVKHFQDFLGPFDFFFEEGEAPPLLVVQDADA